MTKWSIVVMLFVVGAWILGVISLFNGDKMESLLWLILSNVWLLDMKE